MSILGENIAGYLKKHFGEKFLNDYETYAQSEPQYYIRVNENINQTKLLNGLSKYGIELEPIENIPLGFRITKCNEQAGKTIEFTFGQYYIQSLSSMIPALILNPHSTDTVLDLCAAPGSKTTQLSNMMANKGTLYANEVSVPRLRSLVHNLDKINSVNTGILNFKGELLSKVYDHYFDKILVDAPCSALGIVQKKGEVSNWWNSKTMGNISSLQLRLLVAAIKMAKVGGEIVYSTCSLSLDENELVLETVLRKYPVELVDIELPVNSQNAFIQYDNTELNPQLNKAHRIIPWEINSEGFFIAKLRKLDYTDSKVPPHQSKSGRKFSSAEKSPMKKYLNDIETRFGVAQGVLNQFKFILKGKDIFFINKNWETEEMANFNRIGTKFGNIDKYDTAHLHTQSAQLLGNFITENIIELNDYDQLRKYLEGGIIRGIDMERGQKVVQFDGVKLGTAIATGDGLKSQFPRALRTGTIIYPEN